MNWQRLALCTVAIGGFVATGVLLDWATDTRWDYLIAMAAALNLGLIGVFLGFRFGVVRTLAVLRGTRGLRAAEQDILTAAIVLAGNLAQADLDGVGRPLTEDERHLIDTIGRLPEDERHLIEVIGRLPEPPTGS